MKKFLTFFKQRWVISLLGMIALGLLIWFIGPLFAFADYAPLSEELHRWFLMGGILLCWLATRCWAYFKANKENRQIIAAMADADVPGLSVDEQASEDEVNTLQGRLEEALGVLKETRLGSGPDKQFLYQLPWYILIGPPGAGKTTLLKNSELKFPLSGRFGKDAVRGVGGTRNCDWWFTDDAVLLDTAGRYTTQDSHEAVDQAAWLGFLDLLKKNRSRRPINGVIVAVSISDLLEQTSEQYLAQARAIRQRIQELHARFNIDFPVYLLFTKCDLLAGFMEYFDDLDSDNRAQVWGMTFGLDEKKKRNNIEQFSSEFELLQQQIQQQLLDKLERERGGERRSQIYTFPQQFAALHELIKPFLEELFQSSRYAEDIMFRGVYLTSATQEGSPIDRIMGALANNYGLEAGARAAIGGEGKSFFINRLLQRVIFAESGLAGTNLKLEKKRSWLQRGAFMLVSLLTLAMAGIWTNSFFGNRAYIDEMAAQTAVINQQINDINPDSTDVLSLLPLLDEVRQIPGGYADQQRDSTPWSLTFGLYQGDKLGDAAVSLYHRLLKDVFLPRLMWRVETQLRNNTDKTDYLYEALKVYLMLASAERYDASDIGAWYSLDWKYNLPLEVTTGQRESLNAHLLSLLAVRPAPLPRPLDQGVIKQTRNILQNTPIAERVYARLKLDLMKNDVEDFRVSDKAGREASLILFSKSGQPLTTGVPGLYTCKGYTHVFLLNNERLIAQQAGNNWVLGTNNESLGLSIEEINILRENILKLYLQDYIRLWDDLLADIVIKPVTSQAQLVEMLNIVSAKNSPIKLYLEAVTDETSMSCLSKKDQSILEKAGEKFDTARASLDSIMRTSPKSYHSVSLKISPDMVIQHFSGLNELVETTEGMPPALDHTLSVLNELHVYLNSLLHASGEIAIGQQEQTLQVISKLKLEGKRAPFPVDSMIGEIAESSHNLVSGGIRSHLNIMWKSEVLPFCQQAIQGMYPIAKNSREITFEDFTYFFGPGGLMDEYFNKYLVASIEKGRTSWRWNTRGGGGAGVSRSALKQFQRAEKIKNIFFRMGRQSPKISFKLKPISMSPSISQFIIDVDGQTLAYAHGPIRPVPMSWPGPNASGQVRIQLLPPIHGGYSGLSKEGPWALFRLFDAADIQPTSNPTIFIMTFNIQGREAKFELQANSAVNPFQLTDLQSFKCLQNL